MPERIFRYFPSLTSAQKEKIIRLQPLYEMWNSKINVISRKDMDNFYIRHVLHSLSIAKIISFIPSSSVLDVGTGGGFPGIPLAILFPETNFALLDSIEKKIRVVEAVADSLELNNVKTIRSRVEQERGRYDFVISRAVTEYQLFIRMVSKNVSESGNNSLDNGILYLKGGDLEKEPGILRNRTRIWNIKDFFSEPFFETKKIVYLPV